MLYKLVGQKNKQFNRVTNQIKIKLLSEGQRFNSVMRVLSFDYPGAIRAALFRKTSFNDYNRGNNLRSAALNPRG